MANTPPRLPKTAADGAEICDMNGNVWRYSAAGNSWIFSGTLGDPAVVTEATDGLMTPEMFQQLKYLRQQKDAGVNFDSLKIAPATKAMWYYLRSNNRTIRFIPESESKLRLEVNKGHLIKLFSQQKCPGPIGLPGIEGASGVDGKDGPKEITHTPMFGVTDGTSLIIDAEVTAQIDTDISVRLFADGDLVNDAIDIRVPLDSSEDLTVIIDIRFTSIELDLDLTSLEYNPTDGRVTGVVVALDPWEDFSGNWLYKAGQIGRTGPTGDDGLGFLEIVPTTFSDVNLRSTEAIMSLRQGGARGDIYFLQDELFDKNCVNKLSVRQICDTLDVTFFAGDELCLLAVKESTFECKDTTRFCFVPDEPDRPELVLPDWTPVDACWQQRHWSISRFRWANITAQIPHGMQKWPQPNSRVSREPKFPFPLLQEQPPGERCCQDDFFFCSNINDELCPVTGPDGGPPEIPPPMFAPTCCECDCPIALDLQDGYDFDEIGVTSAQTVVIGGDDGFEAGNCHDIVCTLEGVEHQYRQRITVWDQDEEITVTTVFSIKFDDLCDEARQAYLDDLANAHIPSFDLNCGDAIAEEECPFQFSVRDVSTTVPHASGLESMMREGPEFDIQEHGVDITFKHTGFAGSIDYDIRVNTTLLNCCLAYFLEACVTVTIGPETSPSPLPSPSVTLPSMSPSPIAPSVSPSPEGVLTIDCTTLDVCFVIDTTGSMTDEIDSLKSEIVIILNQIEEKSTGDYRLSLITFKDTVTVEVMFSLGNRAEFEATLPSITASGGSGVAEASDVAVQKSADGDAGVWRPSGGKLMILMTDAPPGGLDDAFTPGVDDVAAQAAANTANSQGIHIAAVRTPGNDDANTTTTMQMYADTTNGRHIFSATGTDVGAAVSQLISDTCADTDAISTSEFDITLDIDPSFTVSQQQIFRDAADVWETMIIGDLPDADVPSEGLVDDLLIRIEAISPGDGPGGLLGFAFITHERSGTHLPIRGEIHLDTSDVATLESGGQLMEVVMHEIGHVLGFGSQWVALGLISGAGGSDPRFTGTAALAEYNDIFMTTALDVPVEASGGPGTADVHWRESTFDHELLTGFLDTGFINPISRISLASMQDMGYVVNLAAAENYDPAAPTPSFFVGEQECCNMKYQVPIQIVEVTPEAIWASEEINKSLKSRS